MSPKVSDRYREQKREQILEAAMRAFIRNGYERTTMKDIIEETGCSRGGIYLYFSSTEEVFMELLERNDDYFLSMLKHIPENEQSIWKSILTMLSSIQNSLGKVQEGLGPVIYEYFMTGYRVKRTQELLSKRFEIAVKSLVELLHEGIEKKEFKPLVSTLDISTFLLSYLDGLELNLINHGDCNMNLEIQMNQLILYLRTVLQVSEKQ